MVAMFKSKAMKYSGPRIFDSFDDSFDGSTPSVVLYCEFVAVR